MSQTRYLFREDTLMSNKPIDEFTPAFNARHNAVPAGNARKSSGQDRGTYMNYDPPVPGQGEYDLAVVPKMSGNE
jgi:hypothetical protein